jgi:hypothetical protein
MNTKPFLFLGFLALALGSLCIAASRVRRRPVAAHARSARS